MKSVLFFVANILIFIGDITIWCFSFVFGLPKKFGRFVFHVFSFVKTKRPSFHLPKLSLRMPSVSLPRFSLPQWKLSVPSFLKRKRQKYAKPVVIFPLPITRKLRYFLFGTLFSFLFFFLPAVLYLTLQNIPSPKQLALIDTPQTTKIYDRNHQLLYEMYGNQNRRLVRLSEIPLVLKQATIAIEDKNFYRNPGFDITAIIRATIANIKGTSFQGGSTITQQLIKSTLLSPERSIKRKIEEIILAFWAEKIYSKNQILEMYFNQVPYGGTTWGIGAAAETYFGKDVKDLTLAESAFLAGIPQAPTTYSPYTSSSRLWKNRQSEVLAKMRALGYISSQEERKAKNETLNFKPQETFLRAPYFVMYLKDLLIKKYGLALVEKGGLDVVTSLDLSLNDLVQKTVTTIVNQHAYLHLTNGASLVTDPQNGDILAMVGGKDYYDPASGKVNVTTSLRQPGSSIKLITYTAALSHGYTAASLLTDTPISYSFPGSPSYTPVNYDGKFHGTVTLRTAFGNSFNIPAVKILHTIGVPVFLETARNMGIKSYTDSSYYGLSVTLGSIDTTMLDMATAYGTVANKGARVDLNPLLKVTNYKGDVLEEKKDVASQQILDEGVSFIISDILADNNARTLEFGPNSALVIPNHFVSVKTGTSDNKRDNWTIGYIPNRVVTVWVGNNDNTPMSQNLASGITGAAPIWHSIMEHLTTNTQDTPRILPENVVTKTCFGKTEYFIKGTETTTSCRMPSSTPSPTPH